MTTSRKPYPIVLTQLDQMRCVVIGGGAVAARKVGALLDSGARVKVISPALEPQLAGWHAADQIDYVARGYQTGDLADAKLAIAATNRREVNAAVAADARARGILINIADDPDGSNFHTLAAVTRGDVLVAVGTGGSSPALAALIRRKLEATIGPEYGVLAERLGTLRRELGPTLPPAVRTRLWRALATDESLDSARQGEAVFDTYVARTLDTIRSEQPPEN